MAKHILSLSAPIRQQVLRRRKRRRKTGQRPVNTQTPFEKARAEALKWFGTGDWEKCDPKPDEGILRN
jgi:hypothetical protein